MAIERTILPYVRSGVDHNRNKTNGNLFIIIAGLLFFFWSGDYVSIVSFSSFRWFRLFRLFRFGGFVFAVSGFLQVYTSFAPFHFWPVSTLSSTRFIIYVFLCLNYIWCALTFCINATYIFKGINGKIWRQELCRFHANYTIYLTYPYVHVHVPGMCTVFYVCVCFAYTWCFDSAFIKEQNYYLWSKASF